MQFTQKRKKGSRSTTCKHWFSDEGYRLIWRREVFGIRVPSRWQACVRVIVPKYGGGPKDALMWDFVDHNRRLFKTRKAAEDACRKHHALWTKACKATGIRALVALFGRLPHTTPLWVKKVCDKQILTILLNPRVVKHVEDEDECESPSDPTPTSNSSDAPTSPGEATSGSTPIPESSPVSPAKEEDGSTTRKTRRARSKGTKAETTSSAPPATEPETAPAKRAPKRTAKPSKGGSKPAKSTKRSSASAKKPSTGSRRGKSKRSKS